jgi:hypothetical protein
MQGKCCPTTWHCYGRCALRWAHVRRRVDRPFGKHVGPHPWAYPDPGWITPSVFKQSLRVGRVYGLADVIRNSIPRHTA